MVVEQKTLLEILKEIRDEASIIAHDEPDQWSACDKLGRIWQLAENVIEGVFGHVESDETVYLVDVPSAHLSKELHRRKQEEAEDRRRAINKQYGPCPECGADIAVFTVQLVKEHRSAPGWHSWPVPPPEGYGQTDGADYETTLICRNDHVRQSTETTWFNTPRPGPVSGFGP